MLLVLINHINILVLKSIFIYAFDIIALTESINRLQAKKKKKL